MKMTVSRILLFASFVAVAGLGLRTYWGSYSPAEKWLYVFEQPAREYAVSALQKPVPPELPESLAERSAAWAALMLVVR